MLKELLDTNHCFKLVCGAGNEDIEEIKRLVYVYAIAGCRFLTFRQTKKSSKPHETHLNLPKFMMHIYV